MKSLGDMMAPSTSLNRQIASERSFARVSVSLSRAKAVAAGGKLNDVAPAISSGMLRPHLLKTNQLPDKPPRAAVPISLREAGDSAANNQVFGMYCSLASDIADPKARLERIVEETRKSKGLADPFKPLVPKLTPFSALGAPILPELHSLARMAPEELATLERAFGLVAAPAEAAPAPKKPRARAHALGAIVCLIPRFDARMHRKGKPI